MFKEMSVRDIVYAALFAAITAVLGYISIPLGFSPVPISGQTLGVMLTGSILTTRQATMSLVTFLLLGIAGVPVFAGGTGGIGIIAGPRGGYLIGFLVGAVVISLLKGKKNSVVRTAIANVVGGILIIYLCGVPWLNLITGMGWDKAVVAGALPFIPGDIFKVVVATLVSVSFRKHFPQRGLA
ncbi:MAG: biotin transporter BioY [Bacillota bacterium]